MRVAGKEINDECTKCSEMLQCELFLQGHGIRRVRERVAEMFKCQMRHSEMRKKQKGHVNTNGNN